jgi:hypothetical protein
MALFSKVYFFLFFLFFWLDPKEPKDQDFSKLPPHKKTTRPSLKNLPTAPYLISMIEKLRILQVVVLNFKRQNFKVLNTIKFKNQIIFGHLSVCG